MPSGQFFSPFLFYRLCLSACLSTLSLRACDALVRRRIARERARARAQAEWDELDDVHGGAADRDGEGGAAARKLYFLWSFPPFLSCPARAPPPLSLLRPLLYFASHRLPSHLPRLSTCCVRFPSACRSGTRRTHIQAVMYYTGAHNFYFRVVPAEAPQRSLSRVQLSNAEASFLCPFWPSSDSDGASTLPPPHTPLREAHLRCQSCRTSSRRKNNSGSGRGGEYTATS